MSEIEVSSFVLTRLLTRFESKFVHCTPPEFFKVAFNG